MAKAGRHDYQEVMLLVNRGAEIYGKVSAASLDKSKRPRSNYRNSHMILMQVRAGYGDDGG